MASRSIKNATYEVLESKQNARNAQLGTPIGSTLSTSSAKEKKKFSSIKEQALAEQAEARRLGESIF